MVGMGVWTGLSRRSFLVTAAASLARIAPARAADGRLNGQSAVELIQHALHDAFTTFSSDDQSHERRRQQTEALVRRYADLDRISATILGPYWAKANDDQRRKFASLLVDYGLSVWARPMTGVAEDERQVRLTGTTPADGNQMIVHTVVDAAHDRVPIDWTVAPEPGGRLVITNVTAENVSFIRTMRDDFSSYLSRHHGGLDGLMAAMQLKIDTDVASAK